MDQLFIEVPIPRHHRRNATAGRARWYSWSPASIHLIERNLEGIRALPSPAAIAVRGCDPYNCTYSYRLSALPRPVVRFALEAAEALLRIRTGQKIRFFSGMLGPPLSSPDLHKCFALIRAGVARLKGNPRAALHAPVKTERTDRGFPLHSDVFVTDRLWLVFDDVPKGASGKALFLPRPVFDTLVGINPLMPSVTRQRLRAILDGRMRHDAFDEFYDLIYSPDKPWAESLTRAMKRSCWAIKLHRGEGYLLNDRRWLHGRTAVMGRVSATRFYRLVYGTVSDSSDRSPDDSSSKRISASRSR
jgi:hypothetical protein